MEPADQVPDPEVGLTYQQEFARDRFAQASLYSRLQQPELAELAQHLFDLNAKRLAEKGRPMTDDHLKQVSVAWAKQKEHYGRIQKDDRRRTALDHRAGGG